MAKPDLEDGYLRIAHELDAALACGGFGRDERIVLHEVFTMIFGPAKLKTFDLSPSAIGERYGLPKQSIGRAVTSLLDASVLVRDGLAFRFLKDYERWVWKGKPLLTPAMIRECRKAPKMAVYHVNKNVDESENPASSNLLTNAPGTSSETLTNNGASIGHVNKFDDAASTNALTIVNEFVDAAHYVERAGLRIETNEKGREESPPPPSISKSGTPEADRVANLAAEIGGDIGWAIWACNRFKMGDDPKIVEAALDAAVDAKIIDTTYVAKIIKRLNRDGLPKATSKFSRSGDVPPPTSKRFNIIAGP